MVYVMSTALSKLPSPVERLKRFQKKNESEALQLTEPERDKMAIAIKYRNELLKNSVDAEHTENQANYIMLAHNVLGSVTPTIETIDTYIETCKKLDELKRGVFGEQQHENRGAAIQFNVQNVAGLDPQIEAKQGSNLQVFEPSS